MSLINTQVQPFKTTAFVNRGGKGSSSKFPTGA